MDLLEVMWYAILLNGRPHQDDYHHIFRFNRKLMNSTINERKKKLKKKDFSSMKRNYLEWKTSDFSRTGNPFLRSRNDLQNGGRN